VQITDKIRIYNEDCLEAIKNMPDKSFDLAIVDPPYGIGNKLVDGGGNRGGKFDKNRESINWDVLPGEDYFSELFRVSKEQIIWGSNYFNLPPTRCNIIWDKVQIFTGADFELAWTSFNKASKAFRMSRVEAYSGGKIHPTQKPIRLYEWLLHNYANKGDTILDTHLGSGSIALACHNKGYDLTAYEIDKDYFEATSKRIKDHIAQLTIF
jgi:site-specific DNA-methyltransferase (adenine-specific)